jgi:hypothetical protein
MFEIFSTKDEALAFVKGLEAANELGDMCMSIGEPGQALETLEWTVYYNT